MGLPKARKRWTRPKGEEFFLCLHQLGPNQIELSQSHSKKSLHLQELIKMNSWIWRLHLPPLLVFSQYKNARTVANFLWFQHFSYHIIKMQWESCTCLYYSLKLAGRGQQLCLLLGVTLAGNTEGEQRLCWLSTDPELPFSHSSPSHPHLLGWFCMGRHWWKGWKASSY